MRTIVTAGLAAVLLMTSPRPLAAFCGFYVSGAGSDLYNNATQVVLMRAGTRTVLSMQNHYQGPPDNFAMVVPVPVVLQEENVKTLDKQIFQRVDQLAAPRLVEYWEQDPCRPPQPPYRLSRRSVALESSANQKSSSSADLGVTVEAQFTVGEYEIVILSAVDSAGLDTWLRREKYHIPSGAEPLLRPYVGAGSKFFVAKVDVTKVAFQDGKAVLSPLRFHYDSEQFSLPVRLGMINSAGTQDLIVHILAPGQRYQVANYANAVIPTNLRVADEVRNRFGEFYAALFDRTLEKNPGAVVTEYAWDARTCDPCPTPALNPGELATLGADVLYNQAGPAKKPAQAADPASRRIRPPPGVMGRGFVLTRLHARYGKGALAHDLVFQAAPPLDGGRGMPDRKGSLAQGTNSTSVNQFQGRYAILHEWSGPIQCETPRRGNWGGPPAGRKGSPTATPAVDLAFAPRGKIALASLITQPIPALGLTPAGRAAGSTTEPGRQDDPTGGSKARPSQPSSQKNPTGKKSQGCRATGNEPASGHTGWTMLALVLALVIGRRRSRA
ncbi:MAG: DUF2330 domain-containing protein [Proteobacteria bacterium]|nr:DUF2330 domain-containing protein [Pseudomonadota bacterium]